jgi:hypothetical protein
VQFTHLQSFYDRALVRLHSSGTWEFRRAHVPGVGQRLMDHPSISVASFLLPHAQANLRNKHSYLLGMRFSSGLIGAPRGDMALPRSGIGLP